ncbi:MAG: helix-hairpin-helix domain-containing protein [Planctomycetes bacterium]|nr:helix-hairpin-helix domain-containing protein [Planctomycetota bacterium]
MDLAQRTREIAKPPASWPVGVQFALGLMVTACLFFLLGRWSRETSQPDASPVSAREQPAPALDLNRATRGELRLLPGLGDALAQRVIDHRPFRSVDDLRQVPGIGPKTLERLRPRLFVSQHESYTAFDDDEPMPRESKPRTARLSKKALLLTEPINVNQASQKELQKLPGIGPKLSQRILDVREKGAFTTVADMRRVPGIGPKTIENLRPYVRFE